MKEELELIYKNELYGKKYELELLNYLDQVYGFYESNTESATNKFQQFLNKYSYESLLIDDKYNSPCLVLLHGVDNYEFYPTIQDEGVYPVDKDIGAIVSNLPFEYCESAYNKGYNEDEILDWELQIQTSVIYMWLSQIWLNIDGTNHGRILKTSRNSVTSMFVFNDLSWNSLTKYTQPINKTQRVTPYFKRQISILELYKRVIQQNLINRIEYKLFEFEGKKAQILIGEKYILYKANKNKIQDFRFKNNEEKANWIGIKEYKLRESGYIQIEID